MQQQAIVVATHGTHAIVRAVRAGACGHCAGQSACGTLGAWHARAVEAEVRNPLGAQVGDSVMVHVADGVLLRAMARLYGLPMLAFLLGGMVGRMSAPWLSVSVELAACVGALLATGLAFFWLRVRPVRDVPVMGEIVNVVRADIPIVSRA